MDFDEKVIRLFSCSYDLHEINVKAEIPLYEVKDCYNLNINGEELYFSEWHEDEEYIEPVI